MRKTFLYSFLLVINGLGLNFADQYANPATCGRTSPIADLVCYLDQPVPGQSFALIAFEDGVAALCSYYLNCQPARKSEFNILDVYGYVFNLSYPVKSGNKIKKAYKLWYVDLSVEGCPRTQEIQNLIYNFDGFNQAALNTPIPADEVYFAYYSSYSNFDTACDTFASIQPSCCSNAGDCCNTAPYNFQKPVASLDLGHVKNLIIGQSTVLNNRSSTAQGFINRYGLYASCDENLVNVDIAHNQLATNLCRQNDSDNFPYCNYGADPKCSISKIVESYNYYNLSTLDQNKACTVSTLYAQGYNNQKGQNYCKKSGNGLTTFCGISIILNGGNSPAVNSVVFINFKGFCDNTFRQDITRKILTIC